MRAPLKYLIGIVLGTACLSLIIAGRSVAAAEGEFSLQISPSPLVATIKPGQATPLELKIRNNGSQPESLKIAPRKFKVNSKGEELQLDDTQPSDIADWISFDTPKFTIQPGQTSTVKMTINAPKEAGFSYSLALVINRTDETRDLRTGRILKGSIAIFALLNVDRPGAVRELTLTRFTATGSVYDHLPVRFQIELKNTGNTIAQPAGNIFVQRGANDKTPIDVLPVNKNSSYILPGVTRTLTVDWDNGFEVERTTNEGGIAKKQIDWNWNNLASLRFGPYTAKLVAIYNDGHRDVPIEAETSFWVIPWFLLLGGLLLIGLVGIGLWTIARKTIKTTKRLRPPSSKRFTP
jgi:archaellum component FlaF (FlaF/FlaG flagellin family)